MAAASVLSVAGIVQFSSDKLARITITKMLSCVYIKIVNVFLSVYSACKQDS